MQKKNLIYIIGGAALVGYFIWMKRKKSVEIPQEIPQAATPDQQLAPAFVNRPTRKKPIVSRSRKAKKSLLVPEISQSSVFNAQSIEPIAMQKPTAIQELAQDMMMKPTILSARAARQTAKSTAAQVREAGGSRKEGRQAAKIVRKDARQTRKLGDLSVTF
jgi:hypothetical protein